MVKHTDAVVGLVFGDEGKGKIAQYLVAKAARSAPTPIDNRMPILVERFNGGPNAGHTIHIDDKIYKLHQISCGPLVDKTYSLTGEQTLIDPQKLIKEIRLLREQGVKIDPSRFGIASNAHVILGHHVRYDTEKNFNKEKHTSTGSGISPCAADKYIRTGGLRFEEFLDHDVFKEAVRESLFWKYLPLETSSLDKFFETYAEARELLAPFSVLQTDARKEHGFFYHMGEGAQGAALDVDRGLYPGGTSTNPSMIPFETDRVYGVIKLYLSSIGSGRPFIGKIDSPELESKLRDKFGERGTTTGRPRELGWLDIPLLKYSIDNIHPTYLVGTCGDRLEFLAELGEKIKLVTGYRIDGKIYTKWDKSFHNRRTLFRAEPIYEEFAPWKKFLDHNGELSPQARAYTDRIEELTGVPFALFGTGPGEKDIKEIIRLDANAKHDTQYELNRLVRK